MKKETSGIKVVMRGNIMHITMPEAVYDKLTHIGMQILVDEHNRGKSKDKKVVLLPATKEITAMIQAKPVEFTKKVWDELAGIAITQCLREKIKEGKRVKK